MVAKFKEDELLNDLMEMVTKSFRKDGGEDQVESKAASERGDDDIENRRVPFRNPDLLEGLVIDYPGQEDIDFQERAEDQPEKHEKSSLVEEEPVEQ